MPHILEELYYGNINPNAKQFIRNTSFDRAMRTISDSEAKLTELLTGKEKELFLKMVNAFSEVDGTGNVEHFIEGFRLGARIIIDIMNENDGVLRDIAE